MMQLHTQLQQVALLADRAELVPASTQVLLW
jgi:hypothetical protein